MNLTIRTVDRNDPAAFANYFGSIDFSHKPNWRGCYCQFYVTGGTQEEWQARPAALNRAESVERIAGGDMFGFLAYDGEECVGWCNANDLNTFPRLADRAELHVFRGRSAVIVCFVIRPEYRGKGVGSALIEAVVEHFRAEGYDRVLAQPWVNKENPQAAYHGTPHMYERLGFVRAGGDDEDPIYAYEFRKGDA